MHLSSWQAAVCSSILFRLFCFKVLACCVHYILLFNFMETLLSSGSNGTFDMSNVCKVPHLELGCGSSGTFDMSDVSDFCKALQLELSFGCSGVFDMSDVCQAVCTWSSALVSNV